MLTALYLFIAPFIVLRGRRRAQLEAQGTDVRQLTLVMGVGGAAAVAAFALLLVLAGGTINHTNAWAAVSAVPGVFWCWRFRELFR